jgi:hypothetical protein
MSRSYNKQGLWKDHCRAGSAKGWKKLANRKFRRTFSLDSTRDRQYYRKCTRMSWDIHDYKFLTDKEDAQRSYNNYINMAALGSLWAQSIIEDYSTFEDYYNRYWKRCIRK